MRAFIISLLVVSAIAVNAGPVLKKVEKRGVLTGHHGYSSGGALTGHQGYSSGGSLTGHQGYSSGGAFTGHQGYSSGGALAGHHGYSSGGVASGIVYGGNGVGPSASYLPPVPSVPVIKKPYPVLPPPTYGVPSYAPAVPAPSYGVPSLSVAPSYATSVVPSVPSVGVHGHGPSYNGHHSAPAPSYGVPSFAPAPVYSVPSAPHPVSVGSLSLGSGSLSSSYGVPSGSFESLPAAGVSLGTVSYPSKTYGVPSNVAVGTGLSLSHLSVPSKSYGAPAVVPGAGYSDLSLGSVNLPSTSYGVPSHGAHGGHDDGYSYPAPSHKLLV